MYELEYVKKRKRRKVAAIVGGVSTIVVATLCIVSFLGRSVGTFTVSLDTGNVKLTLSQQSNFATQTSFLRIDNLPTFQEFTYGTFEEKYGDEKIDSEETDLSLGGNTKSDGTITSLNFFKYTFFVKNVGESPARYNFTVNILDRQADTTTDVARTLDKTIRVMIYDNDQSADTHDKKVYAARYPESHIDENGEKSWASPITVANPDDPVYAGYAEEFQNERVITTLSVADFDIGDIRRYTIVIWLEGYQSSHLDEAPKGANMKIGVEINAYENQ